MPSSSRYPLLLTLALALPACGGTSVPPLPPPVRPAPPALAALRIHVEGASMEEAVKVGRATSWISVWLSASFQRALVRAGYRVVVDPGAPTDFVARVDADWQLSGLSVASLTLSDARDAVEQLGGLVEKPNDAGEDLPGTAKLVDALSASRRVADWARRPRTQVAADP